MPTKLNRQDEVIQLLITSSGFSQEGGDPRFKRIFNRLLSDLLNMIDEFDITQEEFWQAISYLQALGESKEVALLAAGTGLEHYLDMRADLQEKTHGIHGGTPRTIEGPLYVANAPVCEHYARMDDGTDQGEILWLYGQVKDMEGKPLADATVDVWHANSLGNYSFFDRSQSEYNLRRQIKTDARGNYCARSIVPSGYGCPPDSPTQKLLNRLGRHGRRPAHIHFFVSAPGYQHLTTQINLNGDSYLWDDFAFATRKELIADKVQVSDPQVASARNLPGAHSEINFNFILYPSAEKQQQQRIKRSRAQEI